MELTFTLRRSAILLVLLAAFVWMGGLDVSYLHHNRYMSRAWLISVIIFVAGSAMITVVDHWIGNLDRMNLRWLYVVMGVLMISGSLMYQHVLRERVKIEMGEPKTDES
ncbi:hypothetical protein [Haloferula sp. BvORR071]|uniref:hypothetical protein n=1 Tax=Haloferula sp. BvORR071 TaxID=1396141 RepID=UPI000551CBE3|nr:hypothetical protein [Haloferula sp. BvORR071]